jgi:hypothetical protein
MYKGGYSSRDDDFGGHLGRRGGSRAQPAVGAGQPHAIRRDISDVGKTVAGSKKRVRWRFTFGEEGDEHEVVLEHSTLSGRKRLYVNDELLFESQKVTSFEWSHGWAMGSHVCSKYNVAHIINI